MVRIDYVILRIDQEGLQFKLPGVIFDFGGNANECISEHPEASALQSESRFDLKRLSEKSTFAPGPGGEPCTGGARCRLGFFR